MFDFKFLTVATVAAIILLHLAMAQAAASPQPQQAQRSSQSQDPNRVQVEAEGIGATKMDALTAAWNEAVQKGVGLFMTSKTEVIDDKLTEKIVTHSRGQVNSYKELSAEKKNDGWHVRISAMIDKDILQETANGIQEQTVKFDGSGMAATIVSGENKAETQKKALESIKGMLDFKDCIDYEFKIEEGKLDGKKVPLAVHTIVFNMDKYIIKIKQIQNVLDRICSSKKNYIFHEYDVKYNKQAFKNLKNKKYKFEQSGRFFYDRASFYSGFTDGDFIIITSTTNGVTYKFEDSNWEIIGQPGECNFYFTTETNDEFDPVIARDNIFISVGKVERGVFPGFRANGNNFLVGQLKQVLNLTNEQLVNIKSLKGKYTIIK